MWKSFTHQIQKFQCITLGNNIINNINKHQQQQQHFPIYNIYEQCFNHGTLLVMSAIRIADAFTPSMLTPVPRFNQFFTRKPKNAFIFWENLLLIMIQQIARADRRLTDERIFYAKTRRHSLFMSFLSAIHCQHPTPSNTEHSLFFD